MPLLLFFVGLFIAGVAIFAETLGLDKNPGEWSRLRIFILSLGITVGTVSALFYAYSDRINKLWKRFLSKKGLDAKAVSFIAFWHEYGPAVLVIPLVIAIYIWYVSSGTWLEWVSPTRYYADLARGFQSGQLHIPAQPDPLLSQLQNPYDPSARAGIEVPHDITYYNGRYYLYWGPVPALFLLVWQSVFGGRVGDLQLVFIFSSGIFMAQFLILLSVWRWYFKQHPKWMLLISIFLTGVAGPVAFMLNNFRGARIYEAAISGGQFFFMGGVFFLFAFFKKGVSKWLLFSAGVLLALAVGTRFFLVISVGAVAALVVFGIGRTNEGLLQKLLNLSFFVLPLFLGAVCLGWYNWSRFGSIIESGLYYQLAGHNIQENYPNLIKPVYAIQNMYNYLVAPPGFDAYFPFFFAEYGSDVSVFPAYNLPELYTSQQMTGLFYLVPFVVFSVIPLESLMFPGLKKRSLFTRESREDDYFYNWMVVNLGVTSLSAFVFLLTFFWAAMRYIEDFFPSLIILSVIGFWQGYQMLADKPALQKKYVSIGLALAIVSIVMSNLIAISINNLRFLFIGAQ